MRIDQTFRITKSCCFAMANELKILGPGVKYRFMEDTGTVYDVNDFSTLEECPFCEEEIQVVYTDF